MAELLAGRYELMETIGAGGMAVVIKARCTLLDRLVAIKLLRDQYAANQEFLDRFQREARAAARLSHPNIVSIYDVGQEDGKQFIVMEYVPGRNLKDYLRAEGPLPPRTVAEIGRQIAAALFHAHQRGIIHRDIKPHNILITPEGQVKVTDFGIARAAAASSLTETGVVLGSVHYFSPEQARGAAVDARSDIYALGVVLYELLTGKLPFEGDSPIAIALRHLDSDPPSPRALRPEVPEALERIILKAMARDPAERYQTAGELQQALKAFLGLEPVEEEPTRVLRPATMAPLPTEAVRPRKRKGGLVWTAVALVFLGLLVGGFLAFRSYFLVPIVNVPDVVGRPADEARRLIEEKGLVYKVLRSEHSDKAPGIVLAQQPEAGTPRKAGVGEEVEVVLSLGPEKVEVPDVRGQTRTAAEAALADRKLVLGTVREEYDAVTPAGLVVAQDPAPRTPVEVGSRVSLVLSLGPPPLSRLLPNLAGQDLSQAEDLLNTLNLKVGRITQEPSNIYGAGKVIRTDPPANTPVTEGDAIDLVVSQGPPPEPQPQSTTFDLKFTVPDGPPEQLVEVWVVAGKNTQRVYRRRLPPGTAVELAIDVPPNSAVRVDIDGRVWKEYPVGGASGQ
ncbi:MAG: eukaryotic-like serine/threonine-protein kinase [Bacillota bacterium]|nr:eukaryotic-like serine/threonine-protein kinase [Bacillota bacterium]